MSDARKKSNTWQSYNVSSKLEEVVQILPLAHRMCTAWRMENAVLSGESLSAALESKPFFHGSFTLHASN